MFEQLKKEVCRANLDLVRHNLVIFTWGNVSAIDKKRQYVAIKPSGVDYDKLKPKDIVVVDLNGNVVDGKLKPSSDTYTHLEIYKNFDNVNAVTHTHSEYATSFAQAKKEIHCLGTTHADHFYGSVPVIRDLKNEEIKGEYEKNTGIAIVEHFRSKNISPLSMQACLSVSHGPFTWGSNLKNAVYNAKVLETVAKMNFYTMMLNKRVPKISNVLLDKHYLRKHGKDAYYGQKFW